MFTKSPLKLHLKIIVGLFFILAILLGSYFINHQRSLKNNTASISIRPTSVPTPTYPPGTLLIKVTGNKLKDADGNTIILRGVNRSGPEYMCIDGGGPVFDGPNDRASIDAMKTWNVNSVRVPLNEQCWLGINNLPNSSYFTETAYRQTIVNYVNLLHSKGMYAILDLQWAAPGTTRSDQNFANKGLAPMPNSDHSLDFWTSVATTFKNDPGTIYDLFNEPHPDNNSGSETAWICWKNGGICPGMTYQAAGMQSLVDAVRNTGATNVIMLAGIQYSNTLTQWLKNKPTDPLNQLVASWHSYDGNICITQSCWDSQVAPIAAQVPVVAGEIGTFNGSVGYISTLMSWLDSKGISYLGWTWTASGCGSAVLISDYSGTACMGYGTAFKAHLINLPHAK